MKKFDPLKVFILTLPIVLAIDFVWIGVIATNFYNTELGLLAKRSGESLAPNWPAAILVYILIVAGIVFFVWSRANGQVVKGLLLGAFFGLVVYGVYDLTNYATLVNWSIKMTIVDTLWGVIICGITGLIAVFIGNFLK